MKKKFTSKRALALGIILFSFLYGIEMMLLDSEILFKSFECVLWVLFFGFCTCLAMRAESISCSLRPVVRFFFAAAVGGVIMWFQPWTAAAKLGAFANGPLGIFAGLFIGYFITAVIVAAVIYGIISFGIGKITKINLVVVIRFVLVASLSAVFVTIFVIIFMIAFQTAASSTYAIFYFFDGMLSQLFFGITYYYVVSLFLNETPSGEREIEAQK